MIAIIANILVLCAVTIGYLSLDHRMEQRTQRLDNAMYYNLRIANHEEWHEVKDRLDMLPFQMRCTE